MAEEALARAGLHIDDLNKIRLLEPEFTQHTTEIRDQCKDFLDSMPNINSIQKNILFNL